MAGGRGAQGEVCSRWQCVCESACVGGAGFGRGVSQQVRDDAVASRVGVCSVK